MTNLSNLLRDLKRLRSSNFGVKKTTIYDLPEDIISEIAGRACLDKRTRNVYILEHVHRSNYLNECEKILRGMLNSFVPFVSVTTRDDFEKELNDENWMTEQTVIQELTSLYNKLGNECLNLLADKYPKIRAILKRSQGDIHLFLWGLFTAYKPQLIRRTPSSRVEL